MEKTKISEILELTMKRMYGENFTDSQDPRATSVVWTNIMICIYYSFYGLLVDNMDQNSISLSTDVKISLPEHNTVIKNDDMLDVDYLGEEFDPIKVMKDFKNTFIYGMALCSDVLDDISIVEEVVTVKGKVRKETWTMDNYIAANGTLSKVVSDMRKEKNEYMDI